MLTPKHLHTIGLSDFSSMSRKEELNFLMQMALDKIAFLPFAYLMDKYRWNIFRGIINESNYNEKWWEMRWNIFCFFFLNQFKVHFLNFLFSLRKHYQGIESPIERSEIHFDAGAKYHTAAYVPYSRYFVARILQFQFYSSLCKLANHRGRLNQCDFYGSKRAGRRLKYYI